MCPYVISNPDTSINDLQQELTSSDLGIQMRSYAFISFAYADNVTLLSLCCQELHLFIHLCESYAKTMALLLWHQQNQAQ